MVSMNILKSFLLSKTRITRFQTVLLGVLTLLFIDQTGCVVPAGGQGYQRFPILYGILAEDRSMGVAEYRIATAQEWRQIQVIRRGGSLSVTPNMTLETGDIMRTGSDVAAAIRFPNGSQLYVRSDSHIRIGSVFAFVGELFVRVKGGFQVDTEFVTAGAEGTEWVLRVSPNGDTRCTVLEGRARMASNEQRWGPIFVGVNNQMVTYGAEYQQVTSASPEDIRQIKRWVGQIDRIIQESRPQAIDENRSFPFIFHFNSRRGHDRGMRGDRPDRTDRDDRPDRTDTDRQPYPKPREDISR